MFKSNLIVSWRNLVKNKAHSIINIGGLSVGMAVAMLIGFWVWDEVSFDKYNKNYDHIARVLQNQHLNDDIATWPGLPYTLAEELRKNYGSDFKHVILSSGTQAQVLAVGDKKLTQKGAYMEPGAAEMLNLQMVEGTSNMPQPASVLLSQSAATTYFGNSPAMGKVITIDTVAIQVMGVYKDMPDNSSFAELSFIAPWQLRLSMNPWIKAMDDPWGNNSFQVYVQLADNADINKVSAKIKDVKRNNIRREQLASQPVLFLQPISRMHLYSEFKNGINTGGRIQFVWLFSIIGVFVLLLACINFMNLSTARSEKRAKEVGIRKAIGSLRSQLMAQFYSESLLVALFAFIVALLWVQLSLPFFNGVADKKMAIPWGNAFFWLAGIGFSIVTGLIAGSYPAIYLSSFRPVKVLKGSFRVGRLAALPRKVLVVVQFTVSIILIIGTVVVFRQVQFAKDRPIGYERDGLVAVDPHGSALHKHFDAMRNELKGQGVIVDMAESANPITAVWRTNGGFDWKGKDPGLSVLFPTNGVSYEYGKLTGWQITAGRDFSREYPTDSSAFILNETAVKYMGLKNPVGETIRWSDGVAFNVIGVVKDMIMESPYEPVRPSFYFLARSPNNMINLKLNPQVSAAKALATIETVFKKYNPDQPFDYKFVDEEYAHKFDNEQRIGKLAGFFSVFAIFISCLGLFGMASFMAEQRIKEIGVRKVLGASVFNVWRLLSKDFVTLVIISLFIATPVAYYFMHNWLQSYTYSAGIAWWIFVVTGLAALVITLLTVSYQAIKAAVANPVRALRGE